MPALSKISFLSAATLVAFAASAHASDISDIARRLSLPIPVVDTVLKSVDTFFASSDAPDNRLTSGVLKELALKTIKAHMSRLDEESPGKASENTQEDKNATYKASVRTTRHESTEQAECVDATATIGGSEGVPVVKEGSFTFDMVHPKNTSYSWKMTFCRTPLNGGSDYTEWQLR